MAKTRVLKTIFKLRRGNAAVFAKNNPVLADGEPAFELDTNKLKIGDGVKAYNDLPYIVDIQQITQQVIENIPTITEEKINVLFN